MHFYKNQSNTKGRKSNYIHLPNDQGKLFTSFLQLRHNDDIYLVQVINNYIQLIKEKSNCHKRKQIIIFRFHNSVTVK